MLKNYSSQFIKWSLLGTALLASSPAPGATATWTGAIGSAWTDVNNWTASGSPPASVPGTPLGTTSDTATFNATAASYSVAVDANRRPFQLNISGGTAYTFSGGPMIMTNGNSTFINVTGTASHTFNNGFSFLNSGLAGISSGGTGSSFINVSGAITGRVAGTNTIQLSGGSTSLSNVASGVISNGTGGNVMSFSKSGAGTWTLSGANTYTGTTVISGGTLLVDGSLAAGSAVSVTAGTLGGVGTISGTASLSSGAKLGVANSLANNLTFATTAASGVDVSAAVGGLNTGALTLELGSIGGSDRFVLSSSGSLAIGTGQLNFNDFSFTTLSGFGTGVYTLFDTGTTIVGSLGSSLTGTIGGLNSTISLSGNGQDILLTVVPEPSSCILITLGIGAVIAMRRRQRGMMA